MEKINLPPFYIGQSVVALKTVGVLLVKDKVYKVTNVIGCKCGVFLIGYGLPHGIENPITQCHECKHTFSINGGPHYIADSRYFAPRQEDKFPLLKISEIRENERSKEFQPAIFEPQILGKN